MAILYYNDRPIVLVTLLLSYALVVHSQQQIPISTTTEATATNSPLQPKKTQGKYYIDRCTSFLFSGANSTSISRFLWYQWQCRYNLLTKIWRYLEEWHLVSNYMEYNVN
jgi:hypothetical protein